jgi:hypothetical protein
MKKIFIVLLLALHCAGNGAMQEENKTDGATIANGGGTEGTGGNGGTGGTGGSGGGYPDTTPPTIVSITPIDGATLVDITTPITVTFSEAMDPATLTTSSIQVLTGPAFTSTIAGTVTLSGGNTVATFTPSVNLSTTTTYRVRVTNAAKDVAGNAITTFTQGTGFTTDKYVITLATFATIDTTPVPIGIAVDSSGNVFTSHGDNRIRKTTPGGVTTVFAGSGSAAFADGVGTSASFNNPMHMDFDSLGNLYVADRKNHRIRKITPAGVVTTLAGSGAAGSTNGTGTAASFYEPFSLSIDTDTNTLYVGETQGSIVGLGCRIRKITSSGVVTTLSGTGDCSNLDNPNPPTYALIGASTIITVHSVKYLILSDNRTIRSVLLADGYTKTLFGSPGVSAYLDAVGKNSRFGFSSGIVSNGSDSVYITDNNFNNIRFTQIDANAMTSTYAGSSAGYRDGALSQAQFQNPRGIARDASGALYVVEATNRLRKIY